MGKILALSRVSRAGTGGYRPPGAPFVSGLYHREESKARLVPPSLFFPGNGRTLARRTKLSGEEHGQREGKAGWWWCSEEKGLGALPRASDLLELRWCGPMSLVLGTWVGPKERQRWAWETKEMRAGRRWTPPAIGSRSCNKGKYLEAGIA